MSLSRLALSGSKSLQPSVPHVAPLTRDCSENPATDGAQPGFRGTWEPGCWTPSTGGHTSYLSRSAHGHWIHCTWLPQVLTRVLGPLLGNCQVTSSAAMQDDIIPIIKVRQGSLRGVWRTSRPQSWKGAELILESRLVCQQVTLFH